MSWMFCNLQILSDLFDDLFVFLENAMQNPIEVCIIDGVYETEGVDVRELFFFAIKVAFVWLLEKVFPVYCCLLGKGSVATEECLAVYLILDQALRERVSKAFPTVSPAVKLWPAYSRQFGMPGDRSG